MVPERLGVRRASAHWVRPGRGRIRFSVGGPCGRVVELGLVERQHERGVEVGPRPLGSLSFMGRCGVEEGLDELGARGTAAEVPFDLVLEVLGVPPRPLWVDPVGGEERLVVSMPGLGQEVGEAGEAFFA